MARSLRDLRRKMKAIKSTRQVTKAMELVSASKMRRATQNAQMLRRYAGTAWNILERIAQLHPGAHPFLEERPVGNVLAILFSSDRGLAGALNTQLFRAVTQYVRGVRELPGFETLDFIAVGKKGQQYLARTKQHVIAAFPALSNHPTFRDALPIARLSSEGFLNGTYEHVVLIYADFISALVQEPRVRALLPFSKTELKEMLESLAQARKSRNQQSAMGNEQSVREYLFEPSQEEVLRIILPQLTEMQIYQAVLEAAASEHSARMVAMRNATDNATGILDDLTLTYNQTRQANITAELAELSASKAALEAA
jgi:F-type H+-transporting ATPase subunit gamma